MRILKLLAAATLMLLLVVACAPAQSTESVGEDHSEHAMPAATTSATAVAAEEEHLHGEADVPFDAMFIDSMIEHHQGAVAMAEEVLEKSERPELLALADEIIAAQTTEIEQMQGWRAAWFPGLEATAGMDMGMGDMDIDADESIPFDQRFLQAMISHHQGAIDMAEEALQLSEHDEIRTLAEAIIAAQTSEIEQMQGWLAEWYGVTE